MIPDLVLPSGDELTKVVQIYIDENPFLICKPIPTTHRDILEGILKQSGITDFKTIDFGVENRHQFGPVPVGNQYRVVGMGLCQNVLRRYYFFGDSTDYKPHGITGIDEEHLEKVQALHPELSLVKND